jgi:hypothetical protein
VVVDPTDPLQRRWFAAVSTEWGTTRSHSAPYRGGLYWTQNRGLSWERLDAIDCGGGQARIQSVLVVSDGGRSEQRSEDNGAGSNELYVTTEGAGLWHASYIPPTKHYSRNRPEQRSAAEPVAHGWRQLSDYPFSLPTRVIANPFNRTELWVASFGNGLYMGVQR